MSKFKVGDKVVVKSRSGSQEQCSIWRISNTGEHYLYSLRDGFTYTTGFPGSSLEFVNEKPYKEAAEKLFSAYKENNVPPNLLSGIQHCLNLLGYKVEREEHISYTYVLKELP